MLQKVWLQARIWSKLLIYRDHSPQNLSTEGRERGKERKPQKRQKKRVCPPASPVRGRKVGGLQGQRWLGNPSARDGVGWVRGREGPALIHAAGDEPAARPQPAHGTTVHWAGLEGRRWEGGGGANRRVRGSPRAIPSN